jgi:dephospho-CoA kinase
MKRLGITGGIGSGKSYIADMLRNELRVPVYDCDARAKCLNEEDPQIREALTELVGPEVYRDGRLVKPVLAAYLFQDESHAAQVNAIVHPAVHRDFLRWEQEQDAGLVALESAILYESGFHRFMDKVLFVRASEPLRIRRAMERDGASREQIEQRIRMQHTQDFESQADYVIDNENTSRSDLIFQLEKIVWEIDWYL